MNHCRREPEWPPVDGINGLFPDAIEPIPVGLEVNSRSIVRPAWFLIPELPFGYAMPVAMRGPVRPLVRGNNNASLLVSVRCGEHNPLAVGRKLRVSELDIYLI